MTRRLLPGVEPARNITFRATIEQREAYERAATASGARTLSDWITRSLDALVAAAEAERQRPSKRSKP